MKLCVTNVSDMLGKRVLSMLENILTEQDILMIISDIPQKIRFKNKIIHTNIFHHHMLKDLDAIVNTDAELTQQILECIDPKTFLIDTTHIIKHHTDTVLIDLSNIESIKQHDNIKKLLPLAHIVTLGICTILRSILSKCQFDFVSLNTCQSISDAGIKAMKALDRERKHEEMHIHDNPQFFDNYIYSNVIPGIGAIDSYLHTSDEKQIIGEVKRLLDHDISISVTCVHVPIKIGHVISVQMHTKHDVNLDSIAQILHKNPDIILVEKPVNITPKDAIGHEQIIISRLRITDGGISFIATYDNLTLQAKTIERMLNLLR